MNYHIVSKNEADQITNRMVLHNEPLPHISWTTNKEVATEFEYDDAERLLAALEYLEDVKKLIIEPANEAWTLISYCITPSYLRGYNFSGPQWSNSQSKAMEFGSEEEAENYSQALKTLFDIHTTPAKLS